MPPEPSEAIEAVYAQLERLQPSPIVSLNRAVAVAMVHGPQPALEIIDAQNDKGYRVLLGPGQLF